MANLPLAKNHSVKSVDAVVQADGAEIDLVGANPIAGIYRAGILVLACWTVGTARLSINSGYKGCVSSMCVERRCTINWKANEHISTIEILQSDSGIRNIYRHFKDMSKIKWKDSIKAIIKKEYQ